MRTSFVNSLIQYASKDEKIFLICGDLGFSVLEPFAEKFPTRFLNIGIAEQNMAGVAAGLALEGFKVFIYSIGNFPSLRALEQIRYDICYKNLNVKIVSVGAGFAYGPLGCSHHATEDFAIMRVLPNMVIYSPCDPVEADWCVDDMLKKQGPCYLRLGKAGEPIIHLKKSSIDINDINYVRVGSNKIIISTGSLVGWIDSKFKNEDYTIISICKFDHSVKERLVNYVKNGEEIICYEEHQLNGGLGSFVLEAISDSFSSGELKKMIPIKRLGIPNKFFSEAGSQSYFRELLFNK